MLFALGATAAERAVIPVVTPPEARPVVRLAAIELAGYLQKLYPAERFAAGNKLPDSGRCILLGESSDPLVRRWLGTNPVAHAEGYRVSVARADGRELGLVAGGGERGVLYGTYALLEKLGCGFDLSGDTLPAARPEPFSFAGWSLVNQPLIADRLVFDWHNFLSGCSTWNLPDWQSWTRQSQKMGYNAIMVHAYGNNPMVSFTFQGRTKPVGYLSTTARGRDWSTMHVNDVRRLWGGSVFSGPVFGADAAQGPEADRAGAAQRLMQEVFAYAGERGMGVFFANDIDTLSANPQEIILGLPPEARFATGNEKIKHDEFWLANPETPEGYAFYRAQVASLLAAYPQITCLVPWFRNYGTPWMELKVSEMPARWQEEYAAAVARTPGITNEWFSAAIFAMSKVVRAYDRALRELGHPRVQLAYGTWRFNFLSPAHRFMPAHIKLIGLDYNVLHDQPQLDSDAARKVIRDVAAHRPVIPVIWAHHDDGNYLGRPYTPFAGFASKLADARAQGFGIIHWTTRPLDLYFTSHARQVWQASKDEPLRVTCDALAARWFGDAARETLGAYLESWVTQAPKFARETTDQFIDRPLTNISEIVAGCRERLQRLGSMDAASLTPEQRARLDYFKGLETFIVDCHQAHGALQRSQALLKSNDLAGARAALAACRPERVIEQFAASSQLGGITRGEQGLVVTMNTRWLPHILRQRQALGLEPVRYGFGPTSHDPLAQSQGRFTWHFDTRHQIWQTLGAAETGASTFVLPPEAQTTRPADLADLEPDLVRSGLECDQPVTLTLGPIMGKAALPAGRYRVRLFLLDPVSTAPGQRVFTITVQAREAKPGASAKTKNTTAAPTPDRVDLFQATGQTRRVLERRYPVTLSAAGVVEVTLTPVQGKALLSAALVEVETE